MATLRVLAAAAALVVVAACGSTDEPVDPALPSDPVSAPSLPAPRSAPSSDPALEQAVRDYSDVYLAGDGAAAHRMLSRLCQRRITVAELATRADQASSRFGDAAIETLDAEIDDEYDDEAEVTTTYTEPALDRDDQDWVLEDGVWKNDDC